MERQGKYQKALKVCDEYLDNTVAEENLILLKIDLLVEYYNNDDLNFSGLVSPKHFFDKGTLLTSNWKEFVTEKDATHNIKYYLNNR